MDRERTFTDNGLGLAGLPGLAGFGLAGCPGVARRLVGLAGLGWLARLRDTGAPAGGYMWGICTWHLYLRGRPAEEFWGSRRRLYVGHLYLAFASVIYYAERGRRKEEPDLT